MTGFWGEAVGLLEKNGKTTIIAPELEDRNGAIFDSKGNALHPSKGLTKEYASRYVEASEKLLSSRKLI